MAIRANYYSENFEYRYRISNDVFNKRRCNCKSCREGNSEIKKPLYDRVTESRVWRWTIGRGSSLLRVPVYLLGSILQTIKMVGKFVVSCLTFNQLRRFECVKSWTFQGLLKDGIFNLNLLQRTVNALWSFIWAPPKNYLSFGQSAKLTAKTVFSGKYHRENTSFLWRSVRNATPNYFQQMIQINSTR